MSDKGKDFTPDNKEAKTVDTEKAAVADEKAASKKVAEAAKGKKTKKNPDGNIFQRGGKKTKRFFKDFKGETKKVVWPDSRTVLKNTGVVILVVAICTVFVFAIDYAFTGGIKGLKHLANPSASGDASGNAVVATVDDTQEETQEETSAQADTTAQAETDAVSE